ncbi:MAG: hypothetical protein KGL12_10930 [Rhodospirillales bacterium]|nr:hypothetical protein [Rhodospirillales bacterium]
MPPTRPAQAASQPAALPAFWRRLRQPDGLWRLGRLWRPGGAARIPDRFAAVAALAGLSLWRQAGRGAIQFLANPPPGIAGLRLGQTGGSGAELARHRADLGAGHGFRDAAYRCQDQDGRMRHLLLSGVPRRRGGGAVRGWHGLAREVTEEIAAADAMAEAQRRVHAAQEAARAAMEEVSGRIAMVEQARAEFLASVSHELRTPLHAIIGFAELIRDQPFGPIASPYIAYARDIHASGQRLLAEVNDLLDLSRIEAGEYRLHEEATALDMVLAGCLAQLRPRAQAAHLALEAARPPPGLTGRVVVRADRQALRQVVQALIEHGMRTTPSGATLRLGLAETAEGDPAITLASSASGAPVEALGGDGVGLVLCRRLLGLHGGRLASDVAGAAGREAGLRLWAILPAARLLHVTPPAPSMPTGRALAAVPAPAEAEAARAG